MTGKTTIWPTVLGLSLVPGFGLGWTETVEVQIIKSTPVTLVIIINEGDTVRWVTTQEVLHTVTSGKTPEPDKKFTAAFIKPKHEVSLDQTGFYDYLCELHPAVMRGVIIIEETGSPP
ncbi:MAG: plastocyanin/azurin family copper-binding protein [Nitrospinota bacterium]|nr:plastocyanin/azurin family copper-binding protein [Nitrospinota bacterium]